MDHILGYPYGKMEIGGRNGKKWEIPSRTDQEQRGNPFTMCVGLNIFLRYVSTYPKPKGAKRWMPWPFKVSCKP